MNRRIALFLLATAVFSLSPAAAADQAMLRAVMPDAIVVAGADVDRVMNSPFGQFMLDRMRAEEENLQKLIEMTGFDPRLHLREVLMASRVPQGKGSGLVMARGTFDVSTLTATASTHGAVLDSYQGATIFNLSNAKTNTDIVALLSGLVLAGPNDDVPPRKGNVGSDQPSGRRAGAPEDGESAVTAATRAAKRAPQSIARAQSTAPSCVSPCLPESVMSPACRRICYERCR